MKIITPFLNEEGQSGAPTVLAGSDEMVVYEDTSTEQIRIFDRGVEVLEHRPVLVDIDPRTGCMTPSRLAERPERLPG